MKCPLAHTRLLFFAAAVGIVVCLAPPNVEASILLPDDSVDLEQILAELGEEDTSASSPGSSDSPVLPNDGYDQESDEQYLTQFFTPNSSGGSSSSTGTSSTTGGSGSYAISSSTLAAISDADAIGWALTERRFTLPMPPGNDLLRPPQSRC